MLKKAFRFILPSAVAVTAVLFLTNAAKLGLAGEKLAAQERAARTVPASGASRTANRLDRAPLRVIQDSHSSFSAVAVDVARDEIVLEDESLQQINVYNRLDNTPPSAALTEPKRMIGGRNTKIAFNCGVYVDPGNGDIYSVNGDTTNYMTVWSREAKGNIPPERKLETPHRAFGVAVDEQAQEVFVTIQASPAVVVYPKTAKEHDKAIRILEGDHTQLADAQGIALDTKNQLLYVSNVGHMAHNRNNIGWARVLKEGVPTWDIPQQGDAWRNFVPGSGEFAAPSITVYPLKASGDTPPLRVIQGSKTQLNWPAHISLDVEHAELYVADPIVDGILVFSATSTGNVAPVRILQGPRTGLKNPHGVYVDAKNDEIVVANYGNHAATIYRRAASGDTPPVRTIRAAPADAPASMLGNVGSLAYDTKRDEILVPN